MSITLETLDLASPVLRELVEHGIRRRWISYEELNTCLPDEFVDPEKIDELLVFMAEHAIEIVADRGLSRQVPREHWQQLAQGMSAAFTAAAGAVIDLSRRCNNRRCQKISKLISLAVTTHTPPRTSYK